MLWVVVVMSALLVVNQSFTNRGYVVKMQELEKQQIHLKLDWESLLLKQSELASLAKIEVVARERLNLQPPEPEQLMVITNG